MPKIAKPSPKPVEPKIEQVQANDEHFVFVIQTEKGVEIRQSETPLEHFSRDTTMEEFLSILEQQENATILDTATEYVIAGASIRVGFIPGKPRGDIQKTFPEAIVASNIYYVYNKPRGRAAGSKNVMAVRRESGTAEEKYPGSYVRK